MDAYESGVSYTYFRKEKGRFYHFYISPNTTVAYSGQNLKIITVDVKRRSEEDIVLNNFNAKSSLWMAPANDTRGEILTKWTGSVDLVVINDDIEPTCIRVASPWLPVRLQGG